MGIFNRTVNKAAISPQPTKAAAAGGTFYQNNNAGAQLVGQYYSYVEGTARNRAMSVCRQLVERAILWPALSVA